MPYDVAPDMGETMWLLTPLGGREGGAGRAGGEEPLQSEGAGVVRASEDEDETGRSWRRGECGLGPVGEGKDRNSNLAFSR